MSENTSTSVATVLGGAVIGREREADVVLAALATRRHVLLEGPPGTGKSTLLRAVADELGRPIFLVEGNAELTPARLLGAFDPAQVLVSGYTVEAFVDGPLLSAMRVGGLLYVEEINRVPEETLNVLITALSEREANVARLGRITAVPGFTVIAALNPFDAVGTARISGAVYDRTCRVTMGYQSAAEETAIAARAVDEVFASLGRAVDRGAADLRRMTTVVDLVRATRSHPDIRQGASVRAAIDFEVLCRQLAAQRGVPAGDAGVTRDAALAALSGRIRLFEGSGRNADDVVSELWRRFFGGATTAPP
ncbi:MAG: AAA family ATPase, partial [Ilumatobacteraceae bacterium]